MPPLPPPARVLLALLLLGLPGVLTGCDSGDDGPGVSAVAGDYDFETFRFVSSSDAFQITVDVLADLDEDDTRLTLVTRERFTLLYRFEGENVIVVDGTFRFADGRVRLRGVEDDEDLYEDVLLPLEITLDYDEAEPDRLEARIRRTVDLEAYDASRYEGLRSIGGTVEIVLRRR